MHLNEYHCDTCEVDFSEVSSSPEGLVVHGNCGCWISPVRSTFKGGYVNTYLIDRAYGGPEEGGWWYTTMTPVESVLFEADQESEFTEYRVKRIHWATSMNLDLPDISSILSQGQYAVLIEGEFAEYQPKVKPHYS